MHALSGGPDLHGVFLCAGALAVSLTFEHIPYISHATPIKTLKFEHGQELRGHRGGRAAACA